MSVFSIKLETTELWFVGVFIFCLVFFFIQQSDFRQLAQCLKVYRKTHNFAGQRTEMRFFV